MKDISWAFELKSKLDNLEGKVESQAALIAQLTERVGEQQNELLKAIDERIDQRLTATNSSLTGEEFGKYFMQSICIKLYS